LGLTIMFVMPVLLVMIVTGMQSGSFALANRDKMPILVCVKDTGSLGVAFVRTLDSMGMFRIRPVSDGEPLEVIRERLHKKEALLAVVLPPDFSTRVETHAKTMAGKALKSFGLEDSTGGNGSDGARVDGAGDRGDGEVSLELYYHPVLQEAFRKSADGALYSALQLVESRQLLRTMYFSINEKPLPDSLEHELLSNRARIEEVPVSMDARQAAPSVSQHNVPAWAIFAMFFVVVSLGSGIVRDKLNGSFVRLKTLPTSYAVAIVSKQITYLGVTMLQTALVFAVGIWIFPLVGLPGLELPADWYGLVLISLLAGGCAVSYAICVGVFARTEEQANGFGALSIVILAAVGGLMVPDFMMTGTFRAAMKFSPLHWCLDAYYSLFLEGGKLKDVWSNVLSLVIIIVALQGIALVGLKRKKLI
jgi:ABC-2 type transport system permease protein